MSSKRQTLFMIVSMTIMMGMILSGIFTWQASGFGSDFFVTWMRRFVSTYVIVLPTVLIVSPIAQWLARTLDEALGASPNVNASAREIALAAWKANGAGHNGGSFEPWINHLADDVKITMPLGQFRGETIGKANARGIYAAIAHASPRLTYETPLRVTQKGQTIVIEFDDHGTIAGMPYKNRIAASFDIEGSKVSAYREYFGDIDPQIVAMMSAAAPATAPSSPSNLVQFTQP